MSQKTPVTAALATAVAVAACAFEVPGTTQLAGGLLLLQITPCGEFLPSDGREMDSPPWNIDAASAQRVIERFRALRNPPVIDYEHQTLNKEKNGQPAPAAGWMRELRWLDAQGLYAVAELTQRAKDHVASGEYLYFSPVFEYSRSAGTVLAVHMGALTNNPAIHGMEPLSLRAAATAAFVPFYQPETPLNPLLKAVLAALGLPETTAEAAAVAALSAVGPITAQRAQAEAARQALGLGADATGDAVTAACTSLRAAQVPDPAKYVPVSVVDEIKTSLAALTAKQADADIHGAVTAGLADGRLLPAQEAWARDLGKTNLAALTGYLATAQPIAALAGTQTAGKPPVTQTGAHGLTSDELAVAAATGLTPEAYAKAKD